MARLILASASSGRRGVLRGAGIDPLVIVSGVDEDAVAASLPDGSGPAEVTGALATAKASAVAAALDPELRVDSVVIGCDSMLWFDGELRGKPATVEVARREWQSMAGRSGELFTGHCLLRVRDGDIVSTATQSASTTVFFGTPPAAELEAYLASGEPLNVAGAFTLDGLGGWFIERIAGDPSNVIGISLPLVRGLLHDAGLSVTDLWRTEPVPQ